MEQRLELAVRNGTIVTPGHREQADVSIGGGRIAQLGGTVTGAEKIDAGGLLVIPGGIDAHVHLMCAQFTAQVAAAEPGKPVWVDDFWTGSTPLAPTCSPSPPPQRDLAADLARQPAGAAEPGDSPGEPRWSVTSPTVAL